MDNLTETVRQRIRAANTLDESIEILKLLLSSGVAVWTDGSLYNIRQLVANIEGLKIEIYAKEHSPPHFHVKSARGNATFLLQDGSFLNGNLSRGECKLIQFWYEESRPLLIEFWNATRPSDCPVGQVI